MNRQERARLIASLTDDELKQLREHLSRAEGPDAHSAADRRFAAALFGGSADDDDQDVDDEDQGAGEYSEEQRKWARELFAPDDPDANVIAGLTDGRTVGRTTPPRRDDTPRENFNFS